MFESGLFWGIKELHITQFHFEPPVDQSFLISQLKKYPEQFFNLESLTFGHLAVTKKDFSNLVAAIKSGYFRNVKTLKIFSSNIGHREMEILAKCFHSDYLPQLEELDLTNNNIDDEAMHLLLVQIKNLSKLKVLDFRKNNISDVGVLTLSDKIKADSWPNLIRLDLSENKISAVGLLVLAHTFSKFLLKHKKESKHQSVDLSLPYDIEVMQLDSHTGVGYFSKETREEADDLCERFINILKKALSGHYDFAVQLRSVPSSFSSHPSITIRVGNRAIYLFPHKS